MKQLILQRWNVVALVFLIAVFSVGTFCIRQKMVLKADKMSRSLVHGSTKGYQKFLNRYFEQYSLILNRLDYVWHLNNKNPNELVKSLHALMLTDSAIVSVVVEDGQLLETHADSLSISPIDFHLLLQPDSMNREFTKVFRERYLFMGGSMSNHSNCYRGIVIDLYHLHKQFIDSDVYTSIYQVILNQRQQCIYHPDIAMVGKQYPLSGNVLVDGHFNNRLFDSLHTIQSDYLQLPVFAEYNPLMVMGEQWIVLSVSPGFELKDMMAGQERSLLLLFFLFLLLLVGIMIFSLLRWKREFLLRASYEQKNLNLQLKQLKQDSETISIKLELLRSGLNSHFMFNSLGTVKALLSKQDQKAREMLSD